MQLQEERQNAQSVYDSMNNNLGKRKGGSGSPHTSQAEGRVLENMIETSCGRIQRSLLMAFVKAR